MRQRGRPRHPDILTPRQWEVLDLLREGLSDQQIADRLDITLAGAKYHVSEILTKLGVATREEAAAWQPSPEPVRPWWQRALVWSLAWKGAATAALAATAIGIGVLAWGVARTGEESVEASVFEDPHLPPPVTPPTLTREQAIVASGGGYGDVRAVDVQLSTSGAILTAIEPGSVSYGDQLATAWLVRFRAFADSIPPNASIPCCSTPVPDVACRTLSVYVLDDPGSTNELTSTGAITVSVPLPDSECEAPFTGDLAIVRAVQALGSRLSIVHPNPQFPERISSKKVSLDDLPAGITNPGFGANPSTDGRIKEAWLVTFGGRFISIDPSIDNWTPPPSGAVPECQFAYAIIQEPTAVLVADSRQEDMC